MTSTVQLSELPLGRSEWEGKESPLAVSFPFAPFKGKFAALDNRSHGKWMKIELITKK